MTTMTPLAEWPQAVLEAEAAAFQQQQRAAYQERPGCIHLVFAATILVAPDGTSTNQTYTLGELRRELRRRARRVVVRDDG